MGKKVKYHKRHAARRPKIRGSHHQNLLQLKSCNKKYFFHGLRSKLPQLFYFSLPNIGTKLKIADSNYLDHLLIIFVSIVGFRSRRLFNFTNQIKGELIIPAIVGLKYKVTSFNK
jgi:hypothetical protein